MPRRSVRSKCRMAPLGHQPSRGHSATATPPPRSDIPGLARVTRARPLLLSSPAVIPAGFVNVRSPMLPFEELARLGDACGASGANPDEAAVSADCERVARELISAFERPVLKEALYFASR